MNTTPKVHENHDAAVQMGEVSYERPCIIVSVGPDGRISAAPLSSALELYQGLPFHFSISIDERDFKATGLTRSSYAIGDEMAELTLNDLRRKRGQLEGELLKRFKNWM